MIWSASITLKNWVITVRSPANFNAEYNPFYIKARYPELIDRFNIPLDEYPRRCIRQIAEWDKEYADLSSKGVLPHERSKEYASRIIEAMVTGRPL